MQDEWAGIVVHGTNSFASELFAGAGCGIYARYFLRARTTIAAQHGERAHALRGKLPKPLDLLDLALLRVVLAVSPALLAPSGSVSGAVVLRLVQPDRVRKREISSR